MYKLFISLCSCCLLLQACSKTTPHYAIDSGLKASFNYLPGTYWVYKDSLSGEEDSLSVTRNTGLATSDYNGMMADIITIYITEYRTIRLDTPVWVMQLIYHNINLDWQIDYGAHIAHCLGINYPYHAGQDVGNVNRIFTSYYVGRNTFTNVAEVKSSDYSTKWTYYDWFYVSADAGIIKMRLSHPEDSIHRVWELQRYHIVK